jgi:hypothetical protein
VSGSSHLQIGVTERLARWCSTHPRWTLIGAYLSEDYGGGWRQLTPDSFGQGIVEGAGDVLDAVWPHLRES